MDSFTNSFEFSLPQKEGFDRSAFRAAVLGLEIWIPEITALLPVKNISATGIALDGGGDFTYQKGDSFTFDLLLNKKLFIAGLAAHVMRVLDNGRVGCAFAELDKRKEAKLDKLVLEVQKRLIALKRAREAK